MSDAPFKYNDGPVIISKEDQATAMAMDGWREADIARLLHQLRDTSREEIRAAVASITTRLEDEAPADFCEICGLQPENLIEIDWAASDGHGKVCSWLCLVHFGARRAALNLNYLCGQISSLEERQRGTAEELKILDLYRAGAIPPGEGL